MLRNPAVDARTGASASVTRMTRTAGVAVLAIAVLVNGCFFPRKTNVWAHRAAYVVDGLVILAGVLVAVTPRNCVLGDDCYGPEQYDPTPGLGIAAVGVFAAVTNVSIGSDYDVEPAASPRAKALEQVAAWTEGAAAVGDCETVRRNLQQLARLDPPTSDRLAAEPAIRACAP